MTDRAGFQQGEPLALQNRVVLMLGKVAPVHGCAEEIILAIAGMGRPGERGEEQSAWTKPGSNPPHPSYEPEASLI